MKLVTFRGKDRAEHIGALLDGGREIAVLQAGAVRVHGAPSPFFTDMIAFLKGGGEARRQAEATVELIAGSDLPGTRVPLDEAALLSPVPRPESVRDCMAFEDHIINSIRAVGLRRFARLDKLIERAFGRKRSIAYLVNRPWYERPIYYKSNRMSVVGTGTDVRMPAYTRMFDYELEWGIFIGKEGVNIPREEARAYIGGYTVFNDFSARDIQMKEMKGRLGPAKGKDFDTGNAIGPCLATPDEIPDPYGLAMTACINGEEWSRGSSTDMYWTFEEIISYVSQSETLYPGDFIGSGTCSGPQGRGCGLEMGRFLKPGDVIELEVERIGVLRNRVIPG